MNEKYVISIKALNNVMGEPCEEWRYAGIDCSSNYPCWCYSEYHGKSFCSVENAKKWYDLCKEYLFGEYYAGTNFDMSTLAIRKVVYKKVMSLTA